MLILLSIAVRYPTHESAGVEGFVSFYNKDNVEILVDGIKV